MGFGGAMRLNQRFYAPAHWQMTMNQKKPFGLTEGLFVLETYFQSLRATF